ncbi:hypothetical protein METHB2_50018 [Candidatus Methylobacter favarea]|uniref:Uncharacterized protein n=1 Tax=Candidatus Methylobacter favarea TaxID=2707345 RepID=A0A8S0Y6N1_9GAMM|nr:hypothetical protein METHB2_50018 [Candidatus Methylobacter favarea]
MSRIEQAEDIISNLAVECGI